MGSSKVEVLKMTIKEAKDIYKRNNCSLFVMAREDLDNYKLYKSLNIEKNLEMKWKGEVIEELVDLLRETGEYIIFNRLYDLAEGFHDRERLKLMIESIENIRIEDAESSLCVAETIIGRKMLSVRSGMIFWAYDIGAKKEAIILIKKAISFVNIGSNSEEVNERACRDMNTINDIVNLLELGTI